MNMVRSANFQNALAHISLMVIILTIEEALVRDGIRGTRFSLSDNITWAGKMRIHFLISSRYDRPFSMEMKLGWLDMCPS